MEHSPLELAGGGYKDDGGGVGDKEAVVGTFVLAGIVLVMDVTGVPVACIEVWVIVFLVLNSSHAHYSSHAYYLGERRPIPNLA